MPQKRLGNDEFLNELAALLQSTNTATHGSVFLIQKPMPSTDASTSSQTLIRATNGSTVTKKSSKVPTSKLTKKHSEKPKIKLATVVESSDLEQFYTKYAEMCKKGMDGLRKRDKKKAKEKAKAKKKGKTAGS